MSDYLRQQMKTEYITVTPELASNWLKKNHTGRPIRSYQVEYLVEIIRSGQWKTTHQGVALDPEGNLLDGQHRLTAVVKSGITVTMAVTRDMPHEAYEAVDQGLKRTLGDALGQSSWVVSRAGILAKLCAPEGLRRIKKPFPSEIRKAIQLIGEDVELIRSTCGTNRRFISGAGVHVGMAYLMDLYPQDVDYILGLYRMVVLSEIQDGPPVAAPINRQLSSGAAWGKVSGGSTRQVFDVGIGVVFFHPNNREKTTLRISKELIDSTVESVRMWGRANGLGQ